MFGQKIFKIQNNSSVKRKTFSFKKNKIFNKLFKYIEIRMFQESLIFLIVGIVLAIYHPI